MKENGRKELASFRGWLLLFILLHFPLALYNFTSGVYALAGYILAGGVWGFALFNVLLTLILPASLLFLLWKRPLFRWLYVAYVVVTAVNFFITTYFSTGEINGVTISMAIILTVPWTLYIFMSKRVAAVLARGREERAAIRAAKLAPPPCDDGEAETVADDPALTEPIAPTEAEAPIFPSIDPAEQTKPIDDPRF